MRFSGFNMTDDTNTNLSVAAGGDSLASKELLRQMTRRVEEVVELLRAQQEILRKRGMNLPSGSIDGLRSFKLKLDTLNKQLGSDQLELRTLRALAETSALINSSLDTDEILNRVIDTVIQLTGAERGYIVLKNRETGELEFRVARGMDREQLISDAPQNDDAPRKNDFIISKSIVNDVMARGESIITNNALEDVRFQEKQSIIGYALRSIMAVPLKVRGEVIGAVYCDNRILQGLFKQDELDLLTAFANQAAVALDNARLFEEARDQLDAVTSARDLMENTFASISSGILAVDDKQRLTTMNAAARQILNVSDDADIYGARLRDLLPPMDSAFYDALDRVASSGQGIRIETQPFQPNRGQRVWNVTLSVLGAVANESTGTAIVIDDLTEQRAREAQLVEVKRYLPLALVNNIRSVDDIDTRGQEREITAVFADVRGFTAFSEKLAPDALMRVINRYLSVASDAINLYEGIVDKYMGDAVTGLFNTQLNPQDDHALRAVQAAVAMLYDLYALHEILPEEQRLFYGVGIHTGHAVLGNVGGADRREFAVLGEASDISKVLQENANGNIIVSPQTYAYIQDVFECEEVELTKTKGRKDLTVGYKVIRRKKSSRTANLFIDDELADLLKE